MPLLLAFALAMQSAPLPKGTGLPPPETEEGQVMTPVNTLFAGIAARDAAMLATALSPGVNITTATEKVDGTRAIGRSTRDQLLARFTPGPEKFEERLYSPAIEIDGDVAMVWGRYNFYIDGALHHCGYDHFDLVREAGRWTIVNATWSSRTTGCAG